MARLLLDESISSTLIVAKPNKIVNTIDSMTYSFEEKLVGIDAIR